jgi:hypothetical protein
LEQEVRLPLVRALIFVLYINEKLTNRS